MSQGLSSDDLAGMRSTLEDGFYPDSCTIRTPGSPVSDGMGGTTPGTPTDVTGVPCHLSGNSGDEAEIAQRMSADAERLLKLHYDQAILVTDQVIHSGVTYEVLAVTSGRSWKVQTLAALRAVT